MRMTCIALLGLTCALPSLARAERQVVPPARPGVLGRVATQQLRQWTVFNGVESLAPKSQSEVIFRRTKQLMNDGQLSPQTVQQIAAQSPGRAREAIIAHFLRVSGPYLKPMERDALTSGRKELRQVVAKELRGARAAGTYKTPAARTSSELEALRQLAESAQAAHSFGLSISKNGLGPRTDFGYKPSSAGESLQLDITGMFGKQFERGVGVTLQLPEVALRP